MSEKQSPYEVITNRLVSMIEKGVCPWRMPWSKTELQSQRNGITGHTYSGVNQVMTFMTAYTCGYSSPYWMTFLQAKEMGGHVRKGESGTPVVKLGKWSKEDDDGKVVGGSFLKQYVVFNVAQIEGLDMKRYELTVEKRGTVEKLATCEAIVNGYLSRPEVRSGGNRAYYNPSLDFIQMPDQAQFGTDESYYCTLFHELAHSTGHASRLARKGVVDAVAFASHEYGVEELVAEFTASFLCQRAQIDTAVIENSAAYLDAWLKIIKGDSKMLFNAASQAQKAADFILQHTKEAVPQEAQTS